MFDSFAELLRGLLVTFLIVLVLLLALPGAKADPRPDAVFAADCGGSGYCSRLSLQL
jgi:hypothetical protein